MRAAEVVELAAAAGLELAAAAVLLLKESSGGRNIWGHDAVNPGGIYVPGAEVTREAYLAYRARRVELGSQGVGPAQLTHWSLQDVADARGGCWDWRTNVAVGFEHLVGQTQGRTWREGFRRYNGGTGYNPRSEVYADDAVYLLDLWRARLAGAPTEGT